MSVIEGFIHCALKLLHISSGYRHTARSHCYCYI